MERATESKEKWNPVDEGLIPLGQVGATPGALTLLENQNRTLEEFVRRHAVGDWGDVSSNDAERNNQALRDGGRLLSSYSLDGEAEEARLWIITEADRSATTVLLPSEY